MLYNQLFKCELNFWEKKATFLDDFYEENHCATATSAFCVCTVPHLARALASQN